MCLFFRKGLLDLRISLDTVIQLTPFHIYTLPLFNTRCSVPM
ncbi:hypothetical protein Halhy_5715 [Haliscomenobacter hydrossis DSM 1100]|uniref:Uncharacterized protein n=1 Tax=Haliscomenobacter hydrossis (strain ATCC 27775 / DSM 1100 / LMG 10767 / O) TaxID=760192 RepID=F4KVW3_HALH1|nr:hypothetical protein Halhy_5715 [Haliscomenobacter hydrossis DSM 1100]